jgi:MFS transporter, DHA3 family, macrolide efflux protein
MSKNPPAHGWRTFAIILGGQLFSLVGSGLTSFVLGLWILARTHSVTQFALILVSGTLPRIILSPLAGVLIDRLDRRLVMLLSDIGAGLSVMAIAILYFDQQLAVWHIYAGTAIGAACATFQYPAYVASTTLLVPDRQLGRANGLLQLGMALQNVLAPLIAGLLITIIPLGGVLLIDVGTFVISTFTLLIVQLPAPPNAIDVPHEKSSLPVHQMLSGWVYITERPILLGLLIFFAITSFLDGLITALLYPLILSFTSATELGMIISGAGTSLTASSLVMSVWNGPRRRIRGVLGSECVFGLGILLMGLRPSSIIVTLGALIAHAALPVNNVINQTIWQSSVTPTIQGRIFALRQMVDRAMTLIALLLAGPLADNLCNPLLEEHGALASSLGQLIGIGPGRGIGLLFFSMGILTLATTIGGTMMLQSRSKSVEISIDSTNPLITASTSSRPHQ